MGCWLETDHSFEHRCIERIHDQAVCSHPDHRVPGDLWGQTDPLRLSK